MVGLKGSLAIKACGSYYNNNSLYYINKLLNWHAMNSLAVKSSGCNTTLSLWVPPLFLRSWMWRQYIPLEGLKQCCIFLLVITAWHNVSICCKTDIIFAHRLTLYCTLQHMFIHVGFGGLNMKSLVPKWVWSLESLAFDGETRFRK